METEQKQTDTQFWRETIKNHWLVLDLMVAVIVVLSIIAVMVIIWHIETSYIGNYGKATLDEWSLNWIVVFTIVLILWELLFVGLPAGLIFGLGGYLWWQRLSEEERVKFKEQESKGQKSKNAGNGFGLLLFIAFCIFMAINGYYSVPFGSQPYSFWIYSYMQTIGWLLIIFGIPAAVIGLVYFRYWLNKS